MDASKNVNERTSAPGVRRGHLPADPPTLSSLALSLLGFYSAMILHCYSALPQRMRAPLPWPTWAGLTDHSPAPDSCQANQEIALPFPPVFFLLPGCLGRSVGERGRSLGPAVPGTP